uniref:EF-hand domain-containing protein n=1 Tax=Lotharella globosa TaxID=91324 RepID=A0A7S4DYL2_9EUKA
MTMHQLGARKSKMIRHLATIIGISLGCIAGMIPLLFVNEERMLAINVFRKLDVDDSKDLTPQELMDGMAKLGVNVTPEQVKSVFDDGRKETVTFEEFWSHMHAYDDGKKTTQSSAEKQE